MHGWNKFVIMAKINVLRTDFKKGDAFYSECSLIDLRFDSQRIQKIQIFGKLHKEIQNWRVRYVI